jgi:hypothetical protein
LNSWIDELAGKRLVTPGYDLLDIEDCCKFDSTVLASFKSTSMLMQAAVASAGFSGRILRRLPFLAFVFGKLFIVIKRQCDDDKHG